MLMQMIEGKFDVPKERSDGFEDSLRGYLLAVLEAVAGSVPWVEADLELRTQGGSQPPERTNLESIPTTLVAVNRRSARSSCFS